jgi:hypothetical protein
VDTLQRMNDSDATTVFVLGLLGILVCQILAPIAWVKGNTYVKVCAIQGVPPNGLGVAGRILGIIGTLMFVGSVVLGLFFVALGAFTAG